MKNLSNIQEYDINDYKPSVNTGNSCVLLFSYIYISYMYFTFLPGVTPGTVNELDNWHTQNIVFFAISLSIYKLATSRKVI